MDVFAMGGIIKKRTLAFIIAIITLFAMNTTVFAEIAIENTSEIVSEESSDFSDGEIEFDESKFGDVNNDQKVSAADARLLLRCAADLDIVSIYVLTYGDYNKDGEITAADARTALRVSAYLEVIACILHGHDYIDLIIEPTCTSEGYTTKECSRCNVTDGSKTDVTPVAAHTLVSNTTKADCTKAGRFTSKCSVCGYTDEDYEVEPALGHSFSDWTVTAESKSRTCSMCGFAEIEKIQSSGKTIYLTFDDGPGPYTRKLLNYLSAYNVKATFFVTNQSPYYSYLLADIVAEGHAIGVHSLTHEWSIYSSVNSYLKDFNAMHDIIESKTGVDTKIFRFPGGTNNTVSRNYSRGIMASLVKTMTNAGYVYFDWNVDCGDTLGYSSSKIAQTTISQIKNQKISVVLMHDIRNTTVEAIGTIIEFGLNNGYEFKTLNEYSPSCQFKPVN